MTTVRKGQAPDHLPRDEFGRRFQNRFVDPAFRAEDASIARLEAIAWEAYEDSRKAPITRKAGEGFADPSYDVAVEWLDAHRDIAAARKRQADPTTPSRVLVIVGSPRNDGSCPGEISKSFRLAQIVVDTLHGQGLATDLLDLSLVTSEYGRQIHPCKGCVSTAQPLCHFPCSCYPNHSLAQTNDWMDEITVRWVEAHAIVIVTPVHWYMAPSPLKAMIDRLVCASGGNPDISSTHGKKAEEAKALELKGWDYPKHLERRVYGLVVHGDVAGTEGTRRGLSDWLDWLGLIDAGFQSRLDRYIGYYEPYATSHETLDADEDVQEETRVVARAVARSVQALREGASLASVSGSLPTSRPK